MARRRHGRIAARGPVETVEFEHFGRAYAVLIAAGETDAGAVERLVSTHYLNGRGGGALRWAATAAVERLRRTGTARVFATLADVDDWRDANDLPPLDRTPYVAPEGFELFAARLAPAVTA